MTVRTDSYYDNPPQKKTAIFFNERFMAARHERKDTVERKVSTHFLVSGKDPSLDDIGVSRDTVFQ